MTRLRRERQPGGLRWRELADGVFRPTVDGYAERCAIAQMPAERWPARPWAVWLDGTRLDDNYGLPLFWPDRASAGWAAVEAVRNDWHGPARRFDPACGWTRHAGHLMRPLLAGVHADAEGQPMECTPVATIRQWPRRPEFGVFVGIDQRYALETVGRTKFFASSGHAQVAADNEVAHWLVRKDIRRSR